MDKLPVAAKQNPHQWSPYDTQTFPNCTSPHTRLHQIIWLILKDPSLPLSPLHQALDLASDSAGYAASWLGRGHEDPSKIRLHVQRHSYMHHKAFLTQENGMRMMAMLEEIGRDVRVMHVEMDDMTPEFGCAFEAPITGTAMYVGTTGVFCDLVWPLWREVVKVKRGFMGITSGKVLDHGSGKEAYLVYNGWESEDAHWEYWRGEDVREKRGILGMGSEGIGEFYHLIFEKRGDEDGDDAVADV